jgi:hypothetical protein
VPLIGAGRDQGFKVGEIIEYEGVGFSHEAILSDLEVTETADELLYWVACCHIIALGLS